MKAIKLNGEFISATDVVALASKLDIDCLSCQTHLFDTAIMILVGNGYTIGMYKDTLVITNQRSVVLNSDLLQTIDRLKKQIAELEADNAEFRQLIRDWSIVLEQDDYFQLWHVESVRQAMLEINKEREYIAELEAEIDQLTAHDAIERQDDKCSGHGDISNFPPVMGSGDGLGW